MKLRFNMATFILFIAITVVSLPVVCSAEWPTKKLSIVVPFGTGGTTDRIIRLMAPYLEKEIGVPVVVVNRPGGGGMVGTKAYAANDPSDGSVILYTLQPYLSGLVFKGAIKIDDFDYFGMNYNSPQGIWVNKDSRFTDAETLFKAIQKDPKKVKMTYIPNSWSLPASELLGDRLGAKSKTIPYNSGGKERMAIVAGDCDFATTEVFGTLASAAEELKPLAIFADNRIDAIKETPTINEVMKGMGLKDMPNLSNTRFFLAKTEFRKTYPDRWKMLLEALEKANTNPEFLAKTKKQNLTIVWMDEAASAKSVREAHEAAIPYSDLLK